MKSKVAAIVLVGFASTVLPTVGLAGAIEPVKVADGMMGEAQAVNRRGQVAGRFTGGPENSLRAFYWSDLDGFFDIGPYPGAVATSTRWITEGGIVIGAGGFMASQYIDHVKAFSWTISDGMQIWDLLGRQQHFLAAMHQDTGQVAGSACNLAQTDCRAFIWTSEHGLEDLGTPDSQPGWSCWGQAVNREGQVAGFCTLYGAKRSFLWTRGEGMFMLDDSGKSCRTRGMNDHGDIVGQCEGVFPPRAFAWTSAAGLIDLGTGNAQGINNSGIVAGASAVQGYTRAWVWSTGSGRQFLSDPTVLQNEQVYGLTSKGEVIGQVTVPAQGLQQAFSWSEQSGMRRIYLEPNLNSGVWGWLDTGQIIGTVYSGYSWTPEGGMVALAPLLSWYNSVPLAISSNGRVVGTAGGMAMWNTQPLARTPLLAGWPGVGGAATEGLAIAFDYPNRVELRNAASGAVSRNIPFHNDEMIPLATAMLPDLDGNGIGELAVLALRRTDKRLIAEMRNATGVALRRSVFFALDLDYLAMAVIPSGLGGTSGAGIAVLGKDGSGRPWAQVKDAVDGELLGKVTFDPAYEPFALLVTGDLNGNGVPELAVLGVDALGRVRAQVKDAVSGQLVSMVYFDRNFPPSHAVGVDTTGDGWSDAFAVLGENASGVIRAQVKAAGSGQLLSVVRYENGYVPHGLVVLPDVNESGTPELGVLQRDGEGRVRVQVKDAITGLPVRVVSLPRTHVPREVYVLPAAGTGGGPALAYLGEGPVGRYLLQVRDAKSGQLISSTAVH
jgi:hypothetical protein